MNKQVKKIIKEHAEKTFKKMWGTKLKYYIRDLKRHYRLTGQIGFSVEVKGNG